MNSHSFSMPGLMLQRLPRGNISLKHGKVVENIFNLSLFFITFSRESEYELFQRRSQDPCKHLR